ncbi:SDR family NAD(P)-dependent oxidoreductase [Mumia sp. DW29H23]|uniref:SDR family NAD(P)-dependent oxidoreductase n=1 Tax=Mumia sp. DW29H23 TaxID=3421241 RepID=UPI003D6856B1
MITEESTVVVTGATSGIGLETARELAGMTRRLIVQGPESAAEVDGVVRDLDGRKATVVYVPCDFMRLADVVEGARAMVAAADGQVDALINNAGVPGSPARRLTTDGHERTLQVNLLAMVLLTEQLLPALTRGSRVVNLASATHRMTRLDLADLELEHGYDPVRAYARSKLAIILYTRWLAARVAPRRILPVCLSPGVISTSLLHAMFGTGGASLRHGARNVLAALTDEAQGGDYFDDGQLVAPSPEASDAALGQALMDSVFDALRPFLAVPVTE